MDTQQITETMRAASPHMRELQVHFVQMGEGVAIAKVDYRDELVGDPVTGVLHGGVVTTLLDIAAGMSVISKLGKPTAVATLDLRIDYLRPSTVQEPLHARVECYKLTRQVAFVRGVTYNHREDDPVASMAGTFMLDAGAVIRPKRAETD